MDAAGTAQPVSTDSVADRLPEVLGPFQRALRRSVQATFPLALIPDAQADLLRTVEAHPGVSVGEAATALGVAANTVSTLVRDLVDRDLLERRPSPQDRRSVQLYLAPEAVYLLAEWAQHRADVMHEVVRGLPPDDVAALEAALPALRRVRAALDARTAD